MGLKPGDFQLKEDGKPQTITSVEEHRGEEHTKFNAVRSPSFRLVCGAWRHDQRKQ